jgi:hypothetical protein
MNALEQRTRRDARIAWLRIHGADLPGAYGHITSAQQTALEAARVTLMQAGLSAKTNDPRATRWGLRRLMSEVRGERKPKPFECAQQRWVS